MNKKTALVAICLLLITLLGAGIRFYKLGEAPAGLYIDEAGMGYSAYSILKTGNDEFGKAWPVIFRNFTDFKTPVYIYSLLPMIALFDLSIFVVRLPSALFSALTIPLIFLLVRKLANQYQQKTTLALLTALLMAISPWHILFGRTSYECTIALFLFVLGIYLFYVGLKTTWTFIFAAIILALSIPAYHAERVLTPLTILALKWRHKKQLLSLKVRKPLLVGLVIGVVICMPTLMVSTTPGFMARASGLNIFSQSRQKPSGTIEKYNGPLSFIVNGSWFLSTKEFASLYVSYYSPRYMFNLGDYGPRSSFPDLPTFFVWQFPFYLGGLWLLIKKSNNGLGDLRWLTIFLLVIAPIPAAVTRDPYTTIRALPLVIPQLIIISLGIVELFSWLGKKLKIITLGAVGILVCYSILQLYSSVIILNEFYRGIEWDYGLQEVSAFLEDKQQILPAVMDNSRDDPYIQIAFFLKYDPAKFQQENFEVTPEEYYTNMNRVMEKRIGNIVSRPINWDKDLKIDQYLIGDELAISLSQIKEHQLTLEKEIKYPDDSVAFRIVRTNPGYELIKR